MNMLTSLKALLFSSAATAMPAEGAGAPAVPGEGAADFASLLNGTMEAVPDAQAATTAPALPPTAELTEAVEEGAAPTEIVSPLPHGLATALNAIQTHRKASLPLPQGIAQKVEQATQAAPAETVPAAPAEAELADPVTAQPVPQGNDAQEMAVAETDAVSPEQPAAKPVDLPKALHPAEKTETPEAASAQVPPTIAQQQTEEPETAQGSDTKREDDKAQQPGDTVAAAPVPTPIPVVIIAPPSAPLQPPPAPVQVQDVMAAPARQTTPAPTVAPQAAPVEQPAANAPAVGQAAASASVPAPAVPVTAAAVPQPATPLPADRNVSRDKAPAKAATASATVNLPAERRESAIVDGPVLPDQPLATAPAARAQPVKSEALALLQLVRDQLAARPAGTPARAGEQVSTVARTKAERAGSVSDASASTPLQPVASPVASDAMLQSTLAQPTTLTATPSAAASPPVVDLSASLGAQVVDMGVSGQWIDGLARDIAGLSAHGAQGRFQINADQLGPVQVDIRQGADGAAVSLTVASEAAEMALRQDSDRLRLDAGLSAVRISEVKIERAPHVVEAARADSANQQGSQQQPSQQQSSQTANGWANNSQNMAQSQGQGRWQARENTTFAPKNSGDPAVLNHDETRRAGNDAARARYA